MPVQVSHHAFFNIRDLEIIVLASYNIRDSQDATVWEIAVHRAVAVITGVLWALIASRIWWPAEARRELTIALGE